MRCFSEGPVVGATAVILKLLVGVECRSLMVFSFALYYLCWCLGWSRLQVEEKFQCSVDINPTHLRRMRVYLNSCVPWRSVIHVNVFMRHRLVGSTSNWQVMTNTVLEREPSSSSSSRAWFLVLKDAHSQKTCSCPPCSPADVHSEVSVGHEHICNPRTADGTTACSSWFAVCYLSLHTFSSVCVS